jgi:hypothetical protein
VFVVRLCPCLALCLCLVIVHLRFRVFTDSIVTFSGYMHVYTFAFIMYTYILQHDIVRAGGKSARNGGAGASWRRMVCLPSFLFPCSNEPGGAMCTSRVSRRSIRFGGLSRR